MFYLQNHSLQSIYLTCFCFLCPLNMEIKFSQAMWIQYGFFFKLKNGKREYGTMEFFGLEKTFENMESNHTEGKCQSFQVDVVYVMFPLISLYKAIF